MTPNLHHLLIVVADGEHARFVRAAPDFALHTADRMDSPTAHQRSSDLVSDRPGATFHSDSTTRHAVAPRYDAHEIAKQQFARAVAARINEEAARDDFGQLVVAAPADTLTAIQEHLDRPARVRIVGTLAKDLTKTPDDALQPHLKEWVRPPHRQG
jgi:protein required for attachment to host cells